MDFLKDIFNGKPLTFDEFVQAINAHNGNEANKDKQIKIGNLGSGDYVAKGKYDSEIERLNALLSGKDTDIQTMTATLESLKKGKVDADTLQQKVADAERLLAESKARETDTVKKYALRDALREAKALDVGYMTWVILEKLKGEGKTLELDETEKIKGWDDLLSGVKTQHPKQFETTNGGKEIEENKLPEGDHGKPEPQTLADALRQQYENKQ